MDKKRSTLTLTGTGIVVIGAAYLLTENRGPEMPTGQAGGSQAPANVLLIIADDIGVDKIGAYADDGDPDYRNDAQWLPQTPVIDSLATAGVRFTDAWANPNCSPTRATVMTGRQAYDHGVGNPVSLYSPAALLTEDTSLAELVVREGYKTALFGKWHLGENDGPGGEEWSTNYDDEFTHELNPNTHGFGRFQGAIGGDVANYRRWESLNSWTDYQGTVTASGWLETEYATLNITDASLGWANDQARPWLLVASYNAPHDPLDLPDAACTYSYTDGDFPTEDIGKYQALAECLDIQIGELLAGLDDLDDTLIIFLGDNGTWRDYAEGPFDDGRGKATVFESGVRVPLIVTDGRAWQAAQPDFVSTTDWQRSPTWVNDPGREIADPVSVADIFATVADVADTDGSSGTDSVSLVPFMKDVPGIIRDQVYTEMFNSELTGAAALRSGAMKIKVDVIADGDSRCRDNYQLYNVVSDRYEESDLAEKAPAALETFRAKLEAVVAIQGNGWLDIPDC